MRKFITALLFVSMIAFFTGCEKSDEQKVEDAKEDATEKVNEAKKDAKDALDKVTK